jgi:hypothetical protein
LPVFIVRNCTFFNLSHNFQLPDKIKEWSGAEPGGREGHILSLNLQKYFLPILENFQDAIFAHPQLPNPGQSKPSHQKPNERGRRR